MPKNKTIRLAILVDALGWHLINKHGFLDELTPYRCGTRTVLGFSSSAIPTILTGKHGNQINLWNTIYYSPTTSPFRWLKGLRWLPLPLLGNRYSRFVIRKLARIFSGYSGYFSDFNIPVKLLPNFDLCEKRKIYSPGGIDGNCSIFDYLQKNNFSYKIYSYLDLNDKDIFTQAKHDLQDGNLEFSFLYLCELDAFLHGHVGDSAAEKGKMQWYEQQIDELFKTASHAYETVELHVFSDHGMVKTEKNFDLITKVKETGYQEEKDYLVMYDSTMARFWFFNNECRKAVSDMLQSLDVGAIVSKQTLVDEGAYFEDNRFGELIFLLHPGTIIVPSYMSKNSVLGMHGFDPTNEHMEAAYISNCSPEVYPSHILDLKDLLLKDLQKHTT